MSKRKRNPTPLQSLHQQAAMMRNVRNHRQKEREDATAAGGVPARSLKAGDPFVFYSLERDYLTGAKPLPRPYRSSYGDYCPEGERMPDVLTMTGRRTNRGRLIYTHVCRWSHKEIESRIMQDDRTVFLLPRLARTRPEDDPNYVRDEEEI